jgi:ABC-type multidrug transport system ATPase subunit
MQPIISVKGLSKSYASGFKALSGIDLDIRRGGYLPCWDRTEPARPR